MYALFLKLILTHRYRNPDFLARLADGTNIVDYGTNFKPEVFNPTQTHPEDFFDAICAPLFTARTN